MRFTNNLNLPPALASFLAGDEYDRGPANISVTGLIDPPRKVALIEAHSGELTEDVSDRVYARMGTVIHKMIEDAAPTDGSVIAEQRFYMRVPGPYGEWVVSGGMDNIDLVALGDGSVRIEDWKTAKTDEMVYGIKPERVAQLNIYKILLEANGFKVGALRDYFLLRDHSKVRAAAGSQRVALKPATDEYPPHPVVVHDIEMWPQDVALRYIAERVALHQKAQHDYGYLLQCGDDNPQAGGLPECSDEERWATPPRFAVMKEGNRVASRVLDTREEAEAYLTENAQPFQYDVQPGPKATWKVYKDGSARASKTFPTREEADAWVAAAAGPAMFVQPRPGESLRCLHFCIASQICGQFKTIQEEAASG